MLLIAAATDYQGFAGRQTKDPLAATLNDLNLAAKKSYESLRQAHVADYQKYFKRVSLHLDPLTQCRGGTDAGTAPAAHERRRSESGGVVF